MINIPSAEIWMLEIELVGLFGVIAPTLRAAIKAIYKDSGLCPTSSQRYSSITSTGWATFYNLDVVIALAFKLNTYEAYKIRQKILECLCLQNVNSINLFVSLGSWLVVKIKGV